ncbi:ShlB/FhaC/HecB family hemolysin secretion/activation protein [Noviherbaspirillum pedocola]|uniref:ShlB/FhaC/HecB family hemolysin secretion/activation protein n=1 Tax=Noviherbaspirillum pedocola TaxID=2801341 RepID=A0A934SPI8_9BURK|nr:ShlB/FhaC/HecB family hemolysin secretion/activation protein [Noviherbaspirillum pedocola]MBK4733115.1 ShlB/FhaC/HecB family hemolysin secretion/activation protein [Noviherbaspirillum pedocola]
MAFCAHAADADIRFRVNEYVVVGDAQIPTETLHRALDRYTGAQIDFATIRQAAAALQALYADAGHGAAQVSIPEQDISGGAVRLAVFEPKLGRVSIVGNQHFDEANIRASLPALKEGMPPDLQAIATSARLGNDNYAKQTQVSFRQGENERLLDATVRVADSAPVRQVVTLDNTGTGPTGTTRIGYAFQHANLFNTDHVLTGQYVTSPTHLRDVTILGASYRVPFYRIGGALDFSASYANVNSGVVPTTAGSYGISGSGEVYGLRYTQLLPRIGAWDQRASFGYDYRYYRNNVTPQGGQDSLVPNFVAQPLTLGYSGFMAESQREWRASASLSQNIAGGGLDSSAAYQAPGGRADASASFRVLRYSGFMRRPVIKDWLVQAQLDGQYSADALIPGEQFGIGGVDSVRGFNEREVINDRGYRASVEAQTPDFGKSLSANGMQARALAFYDMGRAQRNHALPGERQHVAISSAGLGLRLTLANRGQLRIDYAQVLQGGGVRDQGQGKLHANLTLIF